MASLEDGRVGWAPVRNPEAEQFVREVWRAFQEQGIPGVLARAADDAEWAPHSAHNRRFRSTAEYRAQLAVLDEAGERVEATGTGLWSHGDVVVVRGRMRIRNRADVLEDTRMYWLFRVREGRIVRMASSPDLAGLLRDAGSGDAVLAREAFIALHRPADL
jgi:ketosteroid isomerase-like protein